MRSQGLLNQSARRRIMFRRTIDDRVPAVQNLRSPRGRGFFSLLLLGLSAIIVLWLLFGQGDSGIKLRTSNPDGALQSTGSAAPSVRDIKIVVVTPRCCDFSGYTTEREAACHAAVMQHCPSGLDASRCYGEAAKLQPCPRLWQPRGYKLSYVSAIRRAVPHLQQLGWRHIETHRSAFAQDNTTRAATQDPADAKCSADGFREQTNAATAAADVLIVDSDTFWRLKKRHPDKGFIVVDTGDSGTLKMSLSRSPGLVKGGLLAVLKPQVLRPAALQNGPIFDYASHLAFIPGAAEQEGYHTERDPAVPKPLLARTRALIPHIYRYRAPHDCGGRLEHARYAGFFSGNKSHWDPKPLRDRPVDIAFFGKIDSGMYSRPKQGLLKQHRQQAVAALQQLGSERPSLVVQPGTIFYADYASYTDALHHTKIFVSPYGGGEWSHKDFEAMLCGCLVLKPRAGAFVAYPNVFVPGQHVLDVEADWGNLATQVMQALENLEEGQRMVDATSQLLLKYSDPAVYAADLDVFLEEVLTPQLKRRSDGMLKLLPW